MDKLSRLDRPSQFGKTQEERLFNVGLELSITWINRILFLKLLEAQLISYHEGDKSYAFLNYQRISSYDDLNSLFFQVLARKFDERNTDVQKAFENVPYLNSSLFEPTEIEHSALFISNLRDDKTLPIHERTVLKDAKGKRRTGELTTLEYLFDFLNAYEFSGEGSENIQEDNKTLINASVLGLIFEKINGYKDGSFFTPGFITMYMCRETIRKAVVQKFNEAAAGNAQSEPVRSQVEKLPPLEEDRGEGPSMPATENKYESITDVYNAIGSRGEFSHQQANALINDIKICDPAVGSGHFLVSALNEMIAVKHDLGVLHDRQGKLLRDYDVHVENDELIITDYNGELFEYHPKNKESQRVQETLFHEKQSIIENCLFGVDINPNSVKICRLRLWIELLKNAYYKNETELETLPNIDINIKCGNSLISRFDLDADLSKALRSSKWNMDSYRIAVQTYRNAENKEQKHEMERLIADIKGDFKTEISRNSKEQRLYDKLSAELYEKHMAPKLFEEELSRAQKSKLKKEREKLEAKVIKLKEQLDEIKDNKIYENAFEWRFEFPEVLDDDGGFVGFDVVIGNPPYINFANLPKVERDFYKKFELYKNKTDLYAFFVGLAGKLKNSKGLICLIIPHTWISTVSFYPLRKFLIDNLNLSSIVEFDFGVFKDAYVKTVIIQTYITTQSTVRILDENFKLKVEIPKAVIRKDEELKINLTWTPEKHKLYEKIKANSKPLGKIIHFSRGIKTSNDKRFLFKENKGEDFYKIIRGRNIKAYRIDFDDEYIWYQPDLMKEKVGSLPHTKEIFTVPEKIITQRINSSGQLLATYDNEQYFCLDTTNVSSKIFDDSYDLKFIVGMINSKLINWWFNDEFKNPTISGYELHLIPIKNNKKVEKIVSVLVNQILTAKQEDPSADTTALEREIDVLVYRLYGLTYEEVKVVDEEFWMGESEYENSFE